MDNNFNVFAINRDICPEKDVVLIQDQCGGCRYYSGFSMENDMPCIKCTYYAKLEEQTDAE